MRVTVVTTWLPTDRAPSSGSFVLRDSAAIRDAGQDVRIIHLVPPHQDDGARHRTLEGMRVLSIPMKPSNPLSVARAADRLHPALKGADVLHSMAMSTLLPLTALDHARALTLPWVHTEHWSGLTNPDTLSPALRAAIPVVGHGLARPDLVTAVCEYLAAPIRALRRGLPTKVVPCIVEPQGAVSEPSGGEDTGSINMVTVGGLVERKDPMACLDVLTELTARGLPATMTFVGEGPLRADIEERLAADPALGERTRLTGNLDAAGVRAELARADVFIGPTRGDNFFVSAAEAITSGRPVVVSDAGGQTEYVTAANGTVLRSGAGSRQWADAVVDTVERLAPLGAAAIAATIGDSFSSAQVGAAYRRLHEEVAGGSLTH
ncbi:glycosyltransferase family 4 protein [uncultured Actinomyces sp.]|uniref:glycosyltransferase family 4 protein n=2 Tax=uncultured Actinomyces sp. TaxID=249061 RepID=UPI0025F1D867|nr:glycosyltransferase family 4 protein [uncultured Actinomyces sp.]